jgi:hypothetical protein
VKGKLKFSAQDFALSPFKQRGEGAVFFFFISLVLFGKGRHGAKKREVVAAAWSILRLHGVREEGNVSLSLSLSLSFSLSCFATYRGFEVNKYKISAPLFPSPTLLQSEEALLLSEKKVVLTRNFCIVGSICCCCWTKKEIEGRGGEKTEPEMEERKRERKREKARDPFVTFMLISRSLTFSLSMTNYRSVFALSASFHF